MKRFFNWLAVLVALSVTAWAASPSDRLKVGGSQRLDVVVTVPDTADVTATKLALDATTHGIQGKRVGIYRLTVAGITTAIDVMVRVQGSGRGLYLDLVAAPRDSGISGVSGINSALAAMDLTASPAVTGHPSTAEDAADSAVITAAGGP